MELGMGMRLDMSQHLEQKILLSLIEKLEQRIGIFEKQILEKAEFVDIDLEGEASQYHVDMLESLVVRELEDQDSLIACVVKSKHKTIADIEKLIVESFSLGDISFDIGTKRNVDVVTLIFSGDQSFTMTVSLDKERVIDMKDSPSFKESEILQNIDSDKTWAVQKYFGSIEVVDVDTGGKRFLICKEFLDGQMLGNFTTDLHNSEELYGKHNMERLAYATGKAVANILTELGGVPLDSNPLNLIVLGVVDSEEITVRYCDVEELRTDKAGINKEIVLIGKSFGYLADHFKRGIKENCKQLYCE